MQHDKLTLKGDISQGISTTGARPIVLYWLAFTLLAMRGVGGFCRAIPFIWGPVPPGVGAPDPSSSVLTPEGRLRLFEAGDVLALWPLDPVPCWLCCICMAGACICPGAGLPM